MKMYFIYESIEGQDENKCLAEVRGIKDARQIIKTYWNELNHNGDFDEHINLKPNRFGEIGYHRDNKHVYAGPEPEVY